MKNRIAVELVKVTDVVDGDWVQITNYGWVRVRDRQYDSCGRLKLFCDTSNPAVEVGETFDTETVIAVGRPA